MNRFRLVMLPTNEATAIVLGNDSHLFYSPSKINMSKGFKASNQHLYLIDTEATINEGDWVIDIHNLQESGIQLVESKYQKNKFNTYKDKNGIFVANIIASTDVNFGLPMIEDETIEDYIKNPNIEIEDVYIEWNYDDNWWADVKFKK